MENKGQVRYTRVRRGVFGQQLGLIIVICILGTSTWTASAADPCGAKVILKVDKYNKILFNLTYVT